MPDLRETVSRLPESPGVYRFYNAADELIYIGKAKSIRKRVSSYFTRAAGINRKTLRMVSEIARCDYTLAGTELDALLLENNLIKENQPKYNILLKDDKTFPYLCILNERFPRIISTRKYQPGQGEFYGPYAGVPAMKNVLELIRKLYSIRTCNLLLSSENIAQKKFRVCLEYHIGNCRGPCVGEQSEESYLDEIAQARSILKGDLSIVQRHFREQMQAHAAALAFERAQQFKDKLETLEGFHVKSTVVNRSMTDIDVATIHSTEHYAYVNYMRVKEGAIIFSKTVEIKKKLDESEEDILSYALQEFQAHYSPLLLSNIPLPLIHEGQENVVPKIGDKKKLIALSLRNAIELQKGRQQLREGKKTRVQESLSILQQELRLPHPPTTIECFDNSNFQGTDPVASMVRFVGGKPDKKGYRHFNIKTVVGPDDFASMKEIVFRRYRRLIEEQGPLPDLIVIDGGKGQLSHACEALKEAGVYGRIPVIGIAKKLEEIYYPEDPVPLHLSKKSPALLLLQHIRDEAHRFAITFHRKKRSQSTIKTGLEEIPGIGQQTANRLLQHFRSVKKIRGASLDELIPLIGKSKAIALMEALSKA